MSKFYSVKVVKEEAQYQWDSILFGLAPDLHNALSRLGKHVPCPIHGGTDGFRFFKDEPFRGAAICNTCGNFNDGFSVLMAVHGWDFAFCLEQVASYLRVPNQQYHPKLLEATHVKKPCAKTIKRDKWLSGMLTDNWRKSLSLNHPDASIARQYFNHRGIDILSLGSMDNALRFHPALEYFDKEQGFIASLPALLAMIKSHAGNITLMRTYLDPRGIKAEVATPKKMMPIISTKNIAGSAIRLAGEQITEEVMGVAEGIETALSVMQSTRMPIWSCINAHQLATFVPPDSIKKVVIWADLDKSETGAKVANALAVNLAARGIESLIKYPPLPLESSQKGWDWNDVLQLLGKEAFTF